MIEIIFDHGQCFVKNTDLGAFPTPWAAHQAAQVLGMDEEPEGPNRLIDRDRRMHVQESNISKANICDYFGREIPGWQKLGLERDKKYKMLRDPEELAKAASTFKRLPILAQHMPVTAETHVPELVIGTVGSDIRYEHPYLKADTAYWTGGAVGAINRDELKDLSSAYHYRPDMTPGEYEGERYDGVMRDIVGNHVALVRKGRAGDDVVVGDSLPIETTTEKYMSQKVLSRTALYAAAALQALMASGLAMDSKPVDTSELFADVTAKNFKEKKPEVAKRLKAALTASGVVLAQDASIEDMVKLVDAMEKPEVKEGADADPATGAPMDLAAIKSAVMDPGANDEEEVEKKRREFLTGKLTPEDLSAYDAICGAKMGADGDLPPGITQSDKEDKTDDMITKPAMDAAISTAVKAEQDRQKLIRKAEIAVQPWVGNLAIAFDSASDVYGKALEILGVKVPAGTHPDALPAILAVQPKPGAKQAPTTIAMDAAPSSDFYKRFPGAERIGAA